MRVRTTFAVLAFLACCGISQGKEERWTNFAEDGDLKYYLDNKSVQSLPDNVYLFWVKSTAKEKDFFKREYNLQNLSYIFTNYEMDCAVSTYRIRGSIMFDKGRREISKTLPSSADAVFEPVPPESMLELAQEEICARAQGGTRQAEADGSEKAASAGTVMTAQRSAQAPAAEPPAPEEPSLPSDQVIPADSPVPPGPAPAVEAPTQEARVPAVVPVLPETVALPERVVPAEPPASGEPAAPPAVPDLPVTGGIGAAVSVDVAGPVGTAARF